MPAVGLPEEDSPTTDIPAVGVSRGGPDMPSRRARRVVVEAPAAGRAGRNLPAAIGVGLLLAGAAVASLLLRKEAFVGLVSLAVVLAVWEISTVFAQRRITVPVIPLAVGSMGMLVSAFVAGEEGLLVAFALTAFGCLVWRIIDGVGGAVPDVLASVFTAAYVPLLAGFAILLLSHEDGSHRVLVFLLVTVASDVGGFVTGVAFGRHPMAPTVSPKKSWEGFAGSVVTCVVAGAVAVVVLLAGPWWAGALLGLAAACSATLGDLSESLLKRDFGIKDMGSLLPGHGGMMDRLDSLLVTAPVAYVVLTLLVPVA
jgi:phosphatidate cytidylyltransferase